MSQDKKYPMCKIDNGTTDISQFGIQPLLELDTFTVSRDKKCMHVAYIVSSEEGVLYSFQESEDGYRIEDSDNRKIGTIHMKKNFKIVLGDEPPLRIQATQARCTRSVVITDSESIPQIRLRRKRCCAKRYDIYGEHDTKLGELSWHRCSWNYTIKCSKDLDSRYKVALSVIPAFDAAQHCNIALLLCCFPLSIIGCCGVLSCLGLCSLTRCCMRINSRI